MSAPTLYHYTCDHGRQLIGMRGKLKPHQHPLLSKWRPLVWLTDLEEPDAGALGLTSLMLDCDRTAWRYRIRTPMHPDTVQPWLDSLSRMWADPDVVRELELTPSQPEHWWISYSPLWGILDQPEVQP